MFNKNDEVVIVDINKVKNDPFLDGEAKRIMEGANYKGNVTMLFTESDKKLISVSFYLGENRVTQVFRVDEIKKVGE
ncbi:hypothetical protein [Listeria cornellensis]|uniref:Uncharacterized protein n=1 Tax=Listeria cornellensis FSL F6-0969 TaxID=1265820 RepID=W7CA71_9LIST|nr:hypothetical protein [Listeria cornellensis]EUJ29593.1 hypothetical protein PCORN_10562 [Listeria cornellensis FSL F6-0969]